MRQSLEAPADGERRRRPVGGLSRIGIRTGGEFDEEAAAELVGACPGSGAEIAGGNIRGSAVQSHLPAPETEREHEVRPWSDPPFAVGLDEEVPAVGGELEAVGFGAANPGATARVVEPQFTRGTVKLFHEPIREDPAEGQAGARHDDAHIERRGSGRVRDALPKELVRPARSRSQPDEVGKAREQHRRDNDQRCLHGFLHATQDHRRSWRWSRIEGPGVGRLFGFLKLGIYGRSGRMLEVMLKSFRYVIVVLMAQSNESLDRSPEVSGVSQLDC
ncbi:MAG: hypothetical protein QOJ64_405 [Acidobacteriota bacterium]|nr:hypothetical protein [Acidobacteriota bacterium]